MADQTRDSGNVSVEAASQERRKLPNFLLSVRLKYVKLGYHYLISNAMYLLLIPLIGVASAHLSTISYQDVAQLWENLKFNLVSVTVCSSLLVFLVTFYFMSRPRGVYLVDFACYKPEQDCTCTREIFMDRSAKTGVFSEENLSFQKKILERSGLGQKTYLPPAILSVPPNPCMAEARKEAEQVMFGAIDQLLAKTGVKAKDIGVLVVNCSLFNPTPSLSAMIVNHYKLRGNIQSYNLGGMGCSAGLISIDLAKQLLQVCLHFKTKNFFPSLVTRTVMLMIIKISLHIYLSCCNCLPCMSLWSISSCSQIKNQKELIIYVIGLSIKASGGTTSDLHA